MLNKSCFKFKENVTEMKNKCVLMKSNCNWLTTKFKTNNIEV